MRSLQRRLRIIYKVAWRQSAAVGALWRAVLPWLHLEQQQAWGPPTHSVEGTGVELLWWIKACDSSVAKLKHARYPIEAAVVVRVRDAKSGEGIERGHPYRSHEGTTQERDHTDSGEGAWSSARIDGGESVGSLGRLYDDALVSLGLHDTHRHGEHERARCCTCLQASLEAPRCDRGSRRGAQKRTRLKRVVTCCDGRRVAEEAL